jgi:hypothetical protein
MEDKQIMPENEWTSWIKELQNLSQCALAYCKDKYDIERFERIREISAEMAAKISDHPLEEIKASFCAGTGYQTPKVVVLIFYRFFIFLIFLLCRRQNKPLLCRVKSYIWCKLPQA